MKLNTSLFVVATFCFSLLTQNCAHAQLFNSDSSKRVTVEDLQLFYTFGQVTADYLLVKQAKSGNQFYYRPLNDEGCIATCDYRTGKIEEVFNIQNIENCPIKVISGFEVSPLESHLLIATADSAIHRNSKASFYYLYDIKYKTLTPLFEGGRQINATFSPNGSMISYIRDNNIYLYKIRYSSTSAVTTDGVRNQIINGFPDWVYEEEFLTTSALEWSPDSKEIAYLRFDESQVPEAKLTFYSASNPHSPHYRQQPWQTTYKYPKAGQKNSVVSVNVFNVDNRTTKTMDTGKNTDVYIPNIQWTGQPKQLSIVRLNRRQNQLDLLIANSASTVSNTLLTLREDEYIDIETVKGFRFFADGQNFVSLNEEDGWRHIWIYGTNGVKKGCLTKGEYDVHEIYGLDDATQTVYYQASKKSALCREVYSVTTDGKTEKCVTGTKEGTYSAKFSANYKYLIQTFSNTSTPDQIVFRPVDKAEGYVLEDNAFILEDYQNKSVLPKQFVEIPLPSGLKLNAWRVVPRDFDANKEYPVMIVQYNGPNMQMVNNKWDVDWEQLLANEGYITYCIDTRGTGSRGEAFRKASFKQLGKVEVEDLLAATRYISEQEYVDSERIGVWGWSYGGYMVASAMSRSNLFKMGIAIALVTDWRFYDSVYSERYMRSPEENSSGYDAQSLVLNANKLSGRLFLVFGATDDNVHLQNQAEYVNALVNANKQFDMFTYPNCDHNINSGNAGVHLYQMMLDYVKRNL